MAAHWPKPFLSTGLVGAALLGGVCTTAPQVYYVIFERV